MTRHCFALVALVALPAAAVAQAPRGMSDEGSGPRLRATPFVGFSPSFKSSGNLAIYTGTEIVPASYSFNYAGGPTAGFNLEYRAVGQFSGVASAAWTSRSRTTFVEANGERYEDLGSNFYLVKVGGLLRFRESNPDVQFRSLNIAIFGGPAFIRENPEVSVLSISAVTGAHNHWGINFGAEAELPLSNRRLAFHAAFEDYVVFWNKHAIEQRTDASIRNEFGSVEGFDVSADPSHLLVARLGFSFRFGM